MDNWKRALSESGWSKGTGSRFRREPDFGNWREDRNRLGLERRSRISAPVLRG